MLSISQLPAKSGFFSTISWKMQPNDQISTPNEYYFYPNKISGARYHKVSTSWVKVLIGTENALARPKSAILIPPFLSTNKLAGLRSL